MRSFIIFSWFTAGVVVLLTSFLSSCKKDEQASFRDNLTRQPWVLASLQVTTFQRYKASVTDTIPVACNGILQTLTFNTSSTASYSNFRCNGEANATGNWSYDANALQLNMDIRPKDALTTAGTDRPFAVSQLVTLGRSSLVFRTGDLNSYYADDLQHKVYRYSFIHQAQ